MRNIAKLAKYANSVGVTLKNTIAAQSWPANERRDIEEKLQNLGRRLAYLQSNKGYLSSSIDAADFDDNMLTEAVDLLTSRIQGLKASISSNHPDHEGSSSTEVFYVKSFKEVLQQATHNPVLNEVAKVRGGDCNDCSEDLQCRWLSTMQILDAQETKIYELTNTIENKVQEAATVHINIRLDEITRNLYADIEEIQCRLKAVDQSFISLRDETTDIRTRYEEDFKETKNILLNNLEELRTENKQWKEEMLKVEQQVLSLDKEKTSLQEKRNEENSEQKTTINDLRDELEETANELEIIQGKYTILTDSSTNKEIKLRTECNKLRQRVVNIGTSLEDQQWESFITEVELCVELQIQEEKLKDLARESSITEVKLYADLQSQENELADQEWESSFDEIRLCVELQLQEGKLARHQLKATKIKSEQNIKIQSLETNLADKIVATQQLRDQLNIQQSNLAEAGILEQKLRKGIEERKAKLQEATNVENTLRGDIKAKETNIASQQREAFRIQRKLRKQIESQEQRLDD
ncbi:hypothetical protein MMC17_008953 [Xylographa soralifera]|nr:hypothetical protein [Xylographa soralifera]